MKWREGWIWFKQTASAPSFYDWDNLNEKSNNGQTRQGGFWLLPPWWQHWQWTDQAGSPWQVNQGKLNHHHYHQHHHDHQIVVNVIRSDFKGLPFRAWSGIITCYIQPYYSERISVECMGLVNVWVRTFRHNEWWSSRSLADPLLWS